MIDKWLVGRVAVSAAALAAVWATPGWSAGKTVRVVGDSITGMAAPQIERDLCHDQLTLSGVYGAFMHDQAPTIQSWAQQGAADWVVELGTNDARYDNTNAQADFQHEVDLLQNQPCVVFVTVNPSLGQTASQLNSDMESEASSNPARRVLDWGNIEHENRRWVTSDGIHPTLAGRRVLARLEARAFAQCPNTS